MRPALYRADIFYAIRTGEGWGPSLLSDEEVKAFGNTNAETRAVNRLTLKLIHEQRIVTADDLKIESVTVAPMG